MNPGTSARWLSRLRQIFSNSSSWPGLIWKRFMAMNMKLSHSNRGWDAKIILQTSRIIAIKEFMKMTLILTKAKVHQDDARSHCASAGALPPPRPLPVRTGGTGRYTPLGRVAPAGGADG